MTSPAALLPPKVAVGEVLKLAKSLGISVTGIGSHTTPDGAREITAKSQVKNNFPIKWDKQTRTITVPGIYFDFATWQYIPPQKVPVGPAANQNAWLRIVVEATYDPLDFWATIEVGKPTLEWVLDANIGPQGPDEFFYYIVHIYDPEEIEGEPVVNEQIVEALIQTCIVKIAIDPLI